jgi:RNA polymerase sigma-70 factor (ECF subfamily)
MGSKNTAVDAKQFTACWDANIRRFVAYAQRHVGIHDAYDIASSAFLTAWRSWSEVPDDPLPWLLSTARGQVRNHHRSQRRRDSMEQRLTFLDQAAYAGSDVAVTTVERHEALELLADMSEVDREVLLLVSWDGLSTEQAAEVLRCRSGTVRMRLSRARARLAAAVNDSSHDTAADPFLRTAQASPRPQSTQTSWSVS